MFPLELRRLSLGFMGLGLLGSGGVLLWASMILLRPSKGGDAHRMLALNALEAARVEPLPVPTRGEFIDRFLAGRNSRTTVAGARC
jgi:hypothetical protein